MSCGSVWRAARQVADPDAFDQLQIRRSVRQRRRRMGIAAIALVIAAGGIGVAAVAFADRGTSVIPGNHPGTSSRSASTQPAPCTGMRVSVESMEGAAGTIRWAWRAQNISGRPCTSFGYPGIDVHGPAGWLNLQVHRGGLIDINDTPQHIVVAPGRSLYFVSYWSDVTSTNESLCTQFDQVKVTLPANDDSNVLSAMGCLSPDSVRVGPVTSSVPTPGR
jgi:hypothetical protein